MKNKKAIFLLFAANSISGFAQGISMIAVLWHFTNVLKKAPLFGIIFFAITFISLFWGLYAGTLIDKYNRKNIFLANSAVGGLVVLFIAGWGFHTGFVSTAGAAIAFSVTFLIYNVHYPNLYSFAQEISERTDYGRITSYLEIQGQVTNALAGAVAAVLLSGTSGDAISLFGLELEAPFKIEKWSLQEIFLLDAITYGIAFLLIFFMKYDAVAIRGHELGNVKQRLKRGIAWLKENPLIFLFGNASYCLFVTILVVNFYLLPIFVDNHLRGGPDVFALSDMFFAIGSIFAGIAIRQLFRFTNTVMAVIILSFAAAAIYFFAALNTSIMIFYACFFLLGLSNAGTRVMRVTYLFNHIPNNVIGRTGSVFQVFNVLFRLFFILIFAIPFFSKANNVIFAFIILGAFVLAAAVVMLINYKQLVDLEKR